MAPTVTGTAIASRALQGLFLHTLLKARGAIIVPVYARLLSPEALGVTTLAAAMVGLLSPFLLLGLHTGTSVQLAHLESRDDVARGFSTVLKVALVTVGGGAVAFAVLLSHLGPALGLGPLVPYAPLVAAVLAGTALRDLVLVVPQLKQEIVYLLLVNLGVEYGGALFAVLLAVRGYGPAGIFTATAIALSVAVTVSAARTLRAEGYRGGLDRAFLSSALRVGVAILPIAAGQWTLQAADNLFLAAWHGEALVGTYGVAYALASAALLVLAAVNFVFFPAAAALWSQGAPRLRALVDRSLRLVTAALGLAAGGAFLLGPWAVVLLAGRRHAAAGGVLPLIVLGYAAFTVMQILQFVPLVVERRAGRIALCYILIGGVNIALNALLIPAWAMPGAAIATLASYLAGAAVMARIARSALPSLRATAAIARPLLVAVMACAAGVVFQVAPAASAAHALTAGGLFVVVYPLLLRSAGAVTAEDWNQLKAAVVAILPWR